jgi:hypothetical protein
VPLVIRTFFKLAYPLCNQIQFDEKWHMIAQPLR